MSAGSASAARLPQAAYRRTAVPRAYVQAAAQAGVPSRLLYAIALHESALAFGPNMVAPWPWTLRMQGRPWRFNTYEEAVRHLTVAVDQMGLNYVYCGPMQVSWRVHQARLGTPAQAIDAYHNLAVGASILRANYELAKGDWFRATAMYYTRDFSLSLPYARNVYGLLPNLVEELA